MRLLAVALCLALSACADAPRRPDAGAFDWLAGCWRLDRGDGAYEEMWLPARADGTLGVAREVRGGRTVSHEFQRIEVRPDGSAVFIAQPRGQEPAEFRMVEHGQGRIAFENPQHDFPTRIEYRLVDLNVLHARIFGTVDGQTRTVEYPMQRIACES